MCVEPRWQPEENDRGRARPLELLGQPSVTTGRRSSDTNAEWKRAGLNSPARLPGVNASRDAAEKSCL